MFNNLVEVIVSINEFGIYNTIIVDNNKKDISLNGKFSKLNLQQFNDFLNTFFRIIREWKNEEYSENENTIINIGIVEKDKQYDFHIYRCCTFLHKNMLARDHWKYTCFRWNYDWSCQHDRNRYALCRNEPETDICK